MSARRDALLRAIAIDVPFLFALKGAVSDYVLVATHFTHVSDDDYARVVIAQELARHPTLDPSGTSWLPFPFWLAGGAMLVLGRSLVMARVFAYVLGVVSVAAPYAAMRAAGCARATSLVGVAVAMALPWSAWLGVATVPEAFTACLVAAAAIAVTSGRARVAASLALFAASLSRYEAWPVCVVFAATCAVAARSERDERGRALLAGVIGVAGPVAWMAWNAHSHGSPLHFVTRVATYRQAIGAADVPLAAKLAAFPVALVSTSPLLVALSLAGVPALRLDPALRRRWLPALASVAAILGFLIYGDVRDGAPTHHPERALLPILWILSLFAADALRTLARWVVGAHPRRQMWASGVALASALGWLAALPAQLRDAPGLSAEESRTAQIARGEALPRGKDWTLTPCAYEHFALMAATGAPERFTILPAPHAPVTRACPRVGLR